MTTQPVGLAAPRSEWASLPASPTGPSMDPGWLIRPLGLVPYAEAFELMHTLAERRLAGEIPDTLIQPEEWYRDNQVEVLSSVHAARLDTSARTVALDNVRDAVEVYTPAHFKDFAVGKANDIPGFLAGTAQYVQQQKASKA